LEGKSQEEALKTLKETMDAGLVLQPGNGRKTWSICMCWGCGCLLLKALKKMEKSAQVAHTSFYADARLTNATPAASVRIAVPWGPSRWRLPPV
jgi:hypothetical protein